MKNKLKTWSEAIGYMCVFALAFFVTTIVFIAIDFFKHGEIPSVSNLNINVISLVGIALSFLIYIIMIRKDKKISLWEYCEARKINFTDICLVIGLGIILSLSFGLMTQLEVLQKLSANHEAKISNEIQADSLLLVIFMTGILAPLIEEILFRGLLYQTLKRAYSVLAVFFIQAIIFAIIHINLLQMIYTFLLALIFAWFVIKLKSLWASILMHMSFNLTSIIVLRVIKESDSIIPFIVLISTSIIMVLVGICSRLFNKKKRELLY